MAPSCPQLALRPAMKLALVCPYDLSRPGGVQDVVLGLASAMRRLGDEVVVVGPGVQEPETDVPVELVGSTVRISANGSQVPVALTPSAWRRTTRAVSDSDLVHVHEPFVPAVGWSGLAHGAQPVVATFHADPSHWVRSLYAGLSAVGRWAVGSATTTAVSPVAASAIPDSWGQPTIVPNGLDVRSFDVDVERQLSRIAFLGRDEPRKGFDVLMGAWEKMGRQSNEAVIEAMGPARDPVRGVVFHGRASDSEKRRILASSGVFVAPNLGGESFGMVVAEAMAAGCAVVASDIPAFRHVAGDSALFFEPGNTGALRDILDHLLRSPNRVAELGSMARARVQQFDWGVVATRYREIYGSALV